MLALPDASGKVNLAINPINTINTNNHGIVNEYKQLQEYQMEMANELQEIKRQLTLKKNNNDSHEYIAQIDYLSNEIQQYKTMNNVLNSQLDELKNKPVSNLDNSKNELLENKKKEVLFELNKLKEEHTKIEMTLEKEIQIKTQLDIKRSEILNLLDKYDYKLFGDEKDIIINYSDMTKINETKPIYRYKLPYIFENVTQITLTDHNFNNNMFNITPYNNKLVIGDIGEYDICSDKFEDINFKNYKTNGKNYLDITIEPGKYDLELLVTKLNSILNKYNIVIGYDPTKFLVQIRSMDGNSQFILINNEYDIYSTLGFEVTNEKSNKFKGKKIANMKVNKQIECFLMNINDTKSLARINVNQNKILSGIMIIKPKISKLSYLDVYFVGENGRPYWHEYDDFNFTLSIKGDIVKEEQEKFINIITVMPTSTLTDNESELNEKKENENNNLEEISLLDQINNMLV